MPWFAVPSPTYRYIRFATTKLQSMVRDKGKKYKGRLAASVLSGVVLLIRPRICQPFPTLRALSRNPLLLLDCGAIANSAAGVYQPLVRYNRLQIGVVHRAVRRNCVSAHDRILFL